MGAPLKLLNKNIVDRIMEATRRGHPREMVAHYAGIDPSTLYKWINLGRDGKQPYQAFVRRLEQAKAEGLHGLLSTIENAAQDQWQAAAWLAERCHGMTKDAPPPIQVTIGLDGLNTAEVVEEYRKEIKPLIDAPTIDLDEE